MEGLQAYLAEFTYLGLFFALTAAGFGVPLSEDLILLAAGLLIFAAEVSGPGVLLACYLGVLTADSVSYSIGRGFGARILSTRLARLAFHPRRLRKARVWFDRYGTWTIFLARFMLGVRFAAILTAGAQRFPFARFLAADACAALIHVPLLIGIGFFFSQAFSQLEIGVRTIGEVVPAAVAVAFLLWFLFRLRRARRAV